LQRFGSVLKVMVLACLALPYSASANTIRGLVQDAAGLPVADATVQVIGTRTQTTTDAAGQFSLPQVSSTDVELHVRAARFMHKNIHLRGHDQPLRIVLSESVMEVVDVTALPWHVSQIESAAPVSVLSGASLRQQQSATLGDTLAKQVGVHSSYYGPVAGTPIIRGLSGPRVLVAQNGLDVGDVSRSGPDHAVTAEATTARQVEILRGPATLFYGSGAVGGVINVVDDRIPQDAETFSQWQLEYNGRNHEPVVQGSLNAATGDFAWHADGFWREADDLKVPGFASIDPEPEDSYGRLDNSAYRSHGATVGGSYLSDSGFSGLSVGRLERTYGIPGHSHQGVAVRAELEQNRLQWVSEYSVDHAILSELRWRYGYTDYQHRELEGEATGTVFSNKLHEARLELFHQPFQQWRGALSVHAKREDSWAQGEEAFTPPAVTSTLALALMEEKHFGNWLLQFGARAERVAVDASSVRLNSADEHTLSDMKQHYTPLSVSLGTVWDFAAGYNVAVSASHSQRAPSTTEVFSLGPHLGAGSFEVGALFDASAEQADQWQVSDLQHSLPLETSNNIDLSLRKFSGDFGFVAGVFYNQIDHFYYSRATGLSADAGHEHGEHDHDDHDHDHQHDHDPDHERLPVYHFTPADAKLYGAELEAHWQVSAPLTLGLIADYTRASLRSGGNLPRTPPLRAGLSADYAAAPWAVKTSVSHYFSANNTAALESPSDAYTWLDAELSYRINRLGKAQIYLRGDNLLNQTARVHGSFIKHIAPRAARSVSAGVRVSF